jgi:hypothetical protein
MAVATSSRTPWCSSGLHLPNHVQNVILEKRLLLRIFKTSSFAPFDPVVSKLLLWIRSYRFEFFHIKILSQKSLQKKFWSKGYKKLSASSPGQATYTINISGCCKKIASG